MANNREISQFAGLVTVNDTTDNVSIGASVNVGAGITLNAGTGGGQFNDTVASPSFYGNAVGNAQVFYGGTTGTTIIRADGIAEFDGTVTVHGTSSGTTGQAAGSEAFKVGNGAGNHRFAVYPDGTTVVGGVGNTTNFNCKINNDGGILAEETIVSGDTSFATPYAYISKDGLGMQQSLNVANATIFADGRVQAVGNLGIGGTLTADANTTFPKFKVIANSGTIETSGYIYVNHDDNPEMFLGRNGTNAFIQTPQAATIQVRAGTTGGVQMQSGETAWTGISDENLKRNLNPIENGLEKVNTLRAVTGQYVDSEKVHPFLIAQDVQKVLPEAVSTDENTGSLLLAYTETIPLLVAALKEATSRIEALESEVKALKG